MKMTFVLTAASVLALCVECGSVAAKQPDYKTSNLVPSNVLWNQNSNASGDYVLSQNFTSGSTPYNSQGADDFVVPQGQEWRITEIIVAGEFDDGSGPATSENVIFYKNKSGIPGVPVKNGTFLLLNGTSGPDFAIVLPGRGVRLKPGTYWVSVVANMDFYGQGLWRWEASTVQHGYEAMWQNEGGGFGICRIWDTIENCQGSTAPDLMFKLKGKSRAVSIRLSKRRLGR